ncbi:hypothetical protein TNCV_836641 [Trichonephila clavipes]|nr:hypothetical protein TNCV_836641 [Trichonephila clavipes]
MRTTNHHRIWNHKPRLIGESRDNICRWEENEQDEGIGQTNALNGTILPVYLLPVLPELLQGVSATVHQSCYSCKMVPSTFFLLQCYVFRCGGPVAWPTCSLDLNPPLLLLSEIARV